MTFQELYSQLMNVRDQLRKKFYANGKTPTICSDEALYSIAKLAPRHKEDLFVINGLGATFIEKYGDYFMIVLNKYHNCNTSTKELNNEVKSTLKTLENRLINISKRNRLLYMSKIYNRYAFDMFSNEEFNQSVLNLLFGKKQSLKLCKIPGADNDIAEKRYKKLSPLLREITKDFRENGQYDLYVGYPYVIGKTKGEDFNVRAPLVLFPISFERDDDEVTIKLDKTKDVLFNNNIILLQNKFLAKNEELVSNVFEDLDSSTFLSQIIEFFGNAGINLSSNWNSNFLSAFEDIKADDFPKFDHGVFNIVPNAVLGKFSLYSSALQKDFEEIIEGNEINNLLDELISNMDCIDFYTDDIAIEEPENNVKQLDYSEKNINYINELNFSQEQAILSVDASNKLVIQGPPGTGKSQTITSLIADAVNKGHNVLMVSQKKAALDVIYSRLGNLSNYTIFLSDVKDKESFYKQLYNLFVANKNIQSVNDEILGIATSIDEQIELLKQIADKLYTEKVNGIEMYKIYQANENNIFKTKQQIEDLFYTYVPQDLINLDYAKLVNLKEKFSNKRTFKQVVNYYSILAKNPFITDVKANLNNFDLKQMEKDFNFFILEQNDFLKKNGIVKLFTQGKRKKAINSLFNKYFDSTKNKHIIYKNPTLLQDIPSLYFDFQDARLVQSLLDEDEAKYGKTLYFLSDENKEIDVNNYLFDFIINCIIQNFEHKNNDILSNIYNFNSIIKQITKSMQKKKDLTKEKLKNTFVSAFYKNIYQSKRYNEINRQIESSRKWSIAKFVKRFNFELFKGIKVWLMTPESVSEVLPLEKGLFDLLIFDEASQIYIEKGIPSIARTNKVVIAGDHKQLRPSSLGFGRFDYEEEEQIDEEFENENAALEEESLLDLARFKYPSVLLNYHYRARYEELINFSNYAFYGGRLNVSPNITTPSTPPIEVIKINNGLWADRCNKNEALKVVETIKNFFKNRKNNESIGVITFNTNQRDLILDELDKECIKDKEFSLVCKKEFERKENGEDFGLFVKNIENVQGDERDCIIFSLGYAKNKEGRVFRNFGWLNQKGGENRLNVAISRAKQKIYIISSISPQELFTDDLKNEGPKLFRKYLEYCEAISNKDNATAKQLLYSFVDEKQEVAGDNVVDKNLENQVYSALASKGLNIDTFVGVGDYKIDIAIKDKDNSKYLLGIEIDGKLYNNSSFAKERDIYRQKYLQSRGWKIYRLWSSNWWHNADKEIENIVKIYNELTQPK